MLRYLLRRTLTAALSVLLATALVFAALLAVPGDPAEVMLGLDASPEALAALRERLGTDLPAVPRYLRWLGGALQGDLGTSITYDRPVAALVVERLAVSLPLTLGAALLACALALPLGVLAATRRGTPLDPLVSGVAQLGAAVPSFWLGLLLILLFGVRLGWLPSGGFPGWSDDPLGSLRSLVLPTIALALGQAAVMTRMTRSALVDTLAQAYVRTARAKGLPARRVTFGHALRAGLVPLVTILGLSVSNLFVGSIVVEQVFALPGLGRLALTAIGNRDLPLVQGEVALYATAILAVGFLVDVAYAWLDPRIRYET